MFCPLKLVVPARTSRSGVLTVFSLNEPDDEDALNEISYLFSVSCRSSFPKEDFFFSLRSAFARRFLPL